MKARIKKAIGEHSLWKAQIVKALESGFYHEPHDLIENKALYEFNEHFPSLHTSLKECQYFQNSKKLHQKLYIDAAKICSCFGK